MRIDQNMLAEPAQELVENSTSTYDNGPALAEATIDGRLYVRRLKEVTGVYYIVRRVACLPPGNHHLVLFPDACKHIDHACMQMLSSAI